MGSVERTHGDLERHGLPLPLPGRPTVAGPHPATGPGEGLNGRTEDLPAKKEAKGQGKLRAGARDPSHGLGLLSQWRRSLFLNRSLHRSRLRPRHRRSRSRSRGGPGRRPPDRGADTCRRRSGSEHDSRSRTSCGSFLHPRNRRTELEGRRPPTNDLLNSPKSRTRRGSQWPVRGRFPTPVTPRSHQSCSDRRCMVLLAERSPAPGGRRLTRSHPTPGPQCRRCSRVGALSDRQHRSSGPSLRPVAHDGCPRGRPNDHR